MTRAEYREQVSAQLGNLQPPERKRVLAELDGHMEDCVEDLSTRGYTAEEAEARAVAVMGDPVETGQAINGQYSALWLFVSQLAFMLCILAALLLIRPTMNTVEALRYRGNEMTEQVFSELSDIPMQPMDMEMSVAGDVIECRGFGFYKTWRTGEFKVRLILCQHDRWPWGQIERNLWDGVCFDSSKYTGHKGNSASGDVPWYLYNYIAYYRADVPVEYGERTVRVRCSYLGRYNEMIVPLDWTGVEP